MKKILVCITIQENSKRLIQQGYKLANSLNGSFHILHIRKGQSIFSQPDSANLLEELFSFGSRLGGDVHFLCGENVLNTINEFVQANNITHLIIGEPPTELIPPSTICNTLVNTLTGIEVCVIPRTVSSTAL